MLKTLILDNYDSFTFNLFQYIAELRGNPQVFKNDELSLDEIAEFAPTHIVISPGPGHPEHEGDFGICGDVIERFMKEVPILGVCLGCQGIATQFGGKVEHAPEIFHGRRSQIKIDNSSPIFEGLPEVIEAMRYHSLVITELSEDFEVIARSVESDLTMGVQHKEHPLYGIQFHPESIGTVSGYEVLKNFLKT